MINRRDSITLSSLQEIIKKHLYELDSCWVIAEINEMKINSNEHCYLELIEKDENTQYIKSRIQATIWASHFRAINPYFQSLTGQALKSGIKIMVKVQIQYHELYGLSLNITDIEPAYTVGEIELRKQKIISQLKEDGVFEINKELPFPVLPQRIAIISSKTAAGYRDFMHQLTENEYGYVFQTTLFEAVMQGVGAESSIIAAFEEIYKNYQSFDVVIIIRGGGSQTDLSCFDLYDLVYHATQCPLPYLTGIGHDKDVSILDMTAHKMLKTPTAVADFFVNHFVALEQDLLEYEDKLLEMLDIKMNQEKEMLVEFYSRCKTILNNTVYREKMLLSNVLPDKIKNLSRQLLERNKLKINSMEVQVEMLNPENILKKGYSITLFKGKRITAATQIAENEEIETILSNIKINSIVKKTEYHERNDL